MEPCTEGKVGAQCLVSFGSCWCSFFERALPQNVGGAKRTRAPHTRVFGSSTPLCVAEEKTACHYNLSSLRKDYIEKTLKIDPKKEKTYFDDFNPTDLEEILDLQHKITKFQKDHDFKQLFSVLIIIDDFVDSVSFSRHNSLLNALYIRGRHFGCNIISSTQKFNGLSTIIRVNSRQLFFFKRGTIKKYKQ